MFSCKHIIVLFSLCLPFLSQAQKEANIWHLGINYKGIDFNQEPPELITIRSVGIPGYAPASMADSSGKLLFFTNGHKTWSASKTVSGPSSLIDTISGQGAATSWSNVEDVITVRQPGSSRYYIFVSWRKDDDIPNSGRPPFTSYFIIDMAADSGHGAQVAQGQDIFPNGSHIAGIHESSKNLVWIAFYSGDRLLLYRLTPSGLNPLPIAHTLNTNGGVLGKQMTFSPDGKAIAFVDANRQPWIYDFNAKNGLIANGRKINGIFCLRSIDFSPSSELLYIPAFKYGFSSLYQCRVNFTDSCSINDTSFCRLIADTLLISDVRLAPNGKIYTGVLHSVDSDSSYLGVIQSPDNLGTLCRFEKNGFYTGGLNDAIEYLPNFVKSYVYSPYLNSTGFCLGDTTSIVLNKSYADSIHWLFGDGNVHSGQSRSASHVYGSQGDYPLIAIAFRYGKADTFTLDIAIREVKQPNLGTDTLLCSGDSLYLDVSDPSAQSYIWNDGLLAPGRMVYAEASYAVSVQNAACILHDSVRIKTSDCNLHFENFCFGDSTGFTGPSVSPDSILWQFTDVNPYSFASSGFLHRFSDTGLYPVKTMLYKGGLSKEITNTIHIHKPLIPELGSDTILCKPALYFLKPKNTIYDSYLWNDGSVNPEIQLNENASVSLRVEDNGCYAFDSVNLYFVNCDYSVSNLCFGDSTRFFSLSSNADSVVWSFADGAWANGPEVKHLYGQGGNYLVKFKVHMGIAQKTISVPVYITHIGDLIPEKEKEVCEHTPFTPMNAPSSYTYTWNNATQTATTFFDSSGLYVLRIGQNGCLYDDSVNIRLIDCSCIVYLPNAFTPDNNFLNESFLPTSECSPVAYRMQIYNRWGQLIFDTPDLGHGWNGQHDGKACPAGVYVYTISFVAPETGRQTNLKDTFLLLR